MERFMQDLRYGLRGLARSPGFTGVAVLTLALGIGAVTSIFTVANAVIFRPLPYPGADRLVALKGTDPENDRGVDASHGRALSVDVERLGETPSVVLGHRLWQSQFGGDVGILGQSIRLNHELYVVVGIMPAGFSFPYGDPGAADASRSTWSGSRSGCCQRLPCGEV